MLFEDPKLSHNATQLLADFASDQPVAVNQRKERIKKIKAVAGKSPNIEEHKLGWLLHMPLGRYAVINRYGSIIKYKKVDGCLGHVNGNYQYDYDIVRATAGRSLEYYSSKIDCYLEREYKRRSRTRRGRPKTPTSC